MNVPLAKEEETLRFLQSLWYRWGCRVVAEICKVTDLSPEQKEALETVLLKPNDWKVTSCS